MDHLPTSFAQVFTSEIERRISLIAAAPQYLQRDEAAELVLAADQFIITPAGREEETKRAHAIGEEAKTIIAGYL